MLKRDESTRKNNVIELFSKRPVNDERNKVDYSLLDQLHGRRRVVKQGKLAQRDNLVVMFPGFCA